MKQLFKIHKNYMYAPRYQRIINISENETEISIIRRLESSFTLEVNMSLSYNKYPLVLYLILTNKCNLNCCYCCSNYNDEVMDLNTAKKHIEMLIKNVFILKQFGFKETAEIVFFGGEPTLELEHIKLLVYHTINLSNTYKTQVEFSIVTNGQIKNTNDVIWIKQHINNIIISIDIPNTLNDNIRLRKDGDSSFKMVNNFIDVNNSTNHKIIIRCTVTERNKDYLLEMVEYCIDKNVSKLQLEPMFETKVSKTNDIEKVDWLQFSNLYIEAQEYGSNKKIKVRSKLDVFGKRSYEFCGYLCNAYKFVSTDNKVYGCIEDLYNKRNMDFNGINNNLKEYEDMIKSTNCSDCIAFCGCGGGCYARKRYSSVSELEYFCKITRSILQKKLIKLIHEQKGDTAYIKI